MTRRDVAWRVLAFVLGGLLLAGLNALSFSLALLLIAHLFLAPR